MRQLVYSEPALADLESILHYLGERHPKAAIRIGEGLLETCNLLLANPELGEKREDLAPHLRMFSYRTYGIYYQTEPSGQRVSIERILHSALDIEQQSF